ncbi:MAG: methyltransferase domain-containing protein, partial [Acidobacteriota bacterium]|nr:methyltransferase domain-containing protein [Acidobacteriota bacterium]
MDWDALAARYDAQLWLEREPMRAALNLARPGEDDRLLDVGTGTGAVLKWLARDARRPRQATGVDSSAAMLARV